MATLYVTDLDGTLLRPDATLSPYTLETLNSLIDRGMRFSFATARSAITADKVTAGLNANAAKIVYNGTFIVQNGRRLWSNFFRQANAQEILALLMEHGIVPIVYSIDGERERFSLDPSRANAPTMAHSDSRGDDPRKTYVERYENLGEIFYFACIDTPETLAPLHEFLRGRFHCVYSNDVYTGSQWLEIMPSTKALAAKQLQKITGCDRIVVFGDGKNDIPLFEIADEGYAVANAHPALKAIATATIGANTDDSVSKWLSEHFYP